MSPAGYGATRTLLSRLAQRFFGDSGKSLTRSSAFKDLGRAAGGTKNEVELLGAAFAAWKIQSWLTGISLLSDGMSGVGKKALTSTGEGKRTSRRTLSRLGLIGAVTVGIIVDEKIHTERESLEKKLGPAGILIAGPEDLSGNREQKGAIKNVNDYIIGGSSGTPGAPPGLSGPVGRPGAGATPHWHPPGLTGPASGSVAAKGASPLTAHQQLTNALIAHPNNLTILGQQVAYDKAALKSAAAQRADGRITNKRYQQEYANYMGNLVSTEQTITSITQAAASKVAAEKKKQADAIKRVSVPGSLL